MMYGLEQGGNLIKFPLSFPELCKCYPNTSFIKNVPLSTYETLGVVQVECDACPDYDRLTQKVSLTEPYKSAEGWIRSWKVESLGTAEQAAVDDSVADKVRAKRNQLLKDTDWTQLPDVHGAVSSASDYVDYRRQLRDITTQDGFPHDVVWPVIPSSSV